MEVSSPPLLKFIIKQLIEISTLCEIIGRQGLEGPPTKAMLLWLGAYICIWLGI